MRRIKEGLRRQKERKWHIEREREGERASHGSEQTNGAPSC